MQTSPDASTISGAHCRALFERSGELEDLEQAIQVNQQAVTLTPDGHAGKPMYLSNLGITLQSRFERSGELEDLEQAIQVNQQAVTLTPDGHAGKPMYLNNLGGSIAEPIQKIGRAGRS